MRTYTFTSESVTEGHPDKLADQISDAVLDAVLTADPGGRVACETLIARDRVVIAGEITCHADIDYEQIARDTVRRVGYTKESGLCPDTCDVLVDLSRQSGEIAAGVDHKDDGDPMDLFGAGDQGIMFGYAIAETDDLMPLPIQLAHALTRRLAQVRHENIVTGLRPDGKSQVSVSYDAHTLANQDLPVRVETVVLAAQHDPEWDLDELRAQLTEHVVRPALGELWRDDLDVRINTAGPFTIGGPAADAGLTGRKIIVDTYGGRARHGGGAFSGKDATKVDRSAAYAARSVAKHIVAAGLAHECEVQIGYAIGEVHPVSVFVESTFPKVANEKIEQAVREHFDLRPAAIIERFGLRRPLYAQTAAYGHMGRSEFAWEQLDSHLLDRLRQLLD